VSHLGIELQEWCWGLRLIRDLHFIDSKVHSIAISLIQGTSDMLKLVLGGKVVAVVLHGLEGERGSAGGNGRVILH
jgi:hypothetical protein